MDWSFYGADIYYSSMGYNNAIYKIFLYSYSIDTYIRIILEGVILYCGLKMIKEIMHKIDNL